MEEAAEIDKDETAERDELKARRPEVAAGLTLPDEDAVFALDTFNDAPELVELVSVDMDINAKIHHGLNTLNPLSTSKAGLEAALKKAAASCAPGSGCCSPPK